MLVLLRLDHDEKSSLGDLFGQEILIECRIPTEGPVPLAGPLDSRLPSKELTRVESQAGAQPVLTEPSESRLDFHKLYIDYAKSIRALTRSRLHDSHLAEDATQETFLRAFAAIHRLDRSLPVWPWLSRIATNVCIDWMRTKRWQLEFPSHELEDGRCTGPEDDPEQHFLNKQQEQAVAEAISAIPERHRRVFLLRELAGWMPHEIADREGGSLDSLKSALKRSRKTFRTVYSGLAKERGLGSFIPAGLGIKWMRLRVRFTGVIQDLGNLIPKEALAMALAVCIAPSLVQVGPPLLAAPAQLATAVTTTPSSTSRTTEHSSSSYVQHPSAQKPNDPSLLDPAAGANEQNSLITNIVASPHYEEDLTVFASGTYSGCGQCPVLFKSSDGGKTWRRLEATGFAGGQLLVPPDYPHSPLLFALGPLGLQRSTDDGLKFLVVVPATPGDLLGSVNGWGQTTKAAVSADTPDRTAQVVIGTNPVLVYKDSNGSLLTGPTLPPDMAGVDDLVVADDGSLLISGQSVKPLTHQVARCPFAGLCTKVASWSTPLVDRSHVVWDKASGTIFAYSLWTLAASVDQGATFKTFDVQRIWSAQSQLVGVSSDKSAPGPFHGVLSILQPGRDSVSEGQVRRYTMDANAVPALQPGPGTPFSGAPMTVLPDGDYLVPWGNFGLRCSTDKGLTWASHC